MVSRDRPELALEEDEVVKEAGTRKKTKSPAPKTRKRQAEEPQAASSERSSILSNGTPHESSAVAAGRPSEEQIRLRAYELFLARGGDHGLDLSDWLLAETQLNGG